jgi:hypothetical protein
MSWSNSTSASFSSSEAIIAHFDEAAGVLVEGGYEVSGHAWESITRALLEETIDEISFWGLDWAGKGEALLRLKIDWDVHTVAVEGGNSIDLPMLDGSIHLWQVRRAGEGFLRAFKGKGLRAQIQLRYRPELSHEWRDLNRRYGWEEASEIEMKGEGAGWEISSRYHAAVHVQVWFGE